MSTKCSVRYTKDFHLYMDYMDEFGGPHAYLRIDNGLVKYLDIHASGTGLTILVRLPPEVFPILRSDIARTLRRSGGLLDRGGIIRELKSFEKLLPLKNRAAQVPTRTDRTARRLRRSVVGLE